MEKRPPITPESVYNDLRYLQLLSTKFPTISDACTEIINLEAILNLPKGTEPLPDRRLQIQLPIRPRQRPHDSNKHHMII